MPSINSLTLAKLILNVKKYGKSIQDDRLDSECVDDLDYNEESSELTVVFKKRGTYKYSGVDLDTYVDFAQSSSWGQYFNNYIRNTGYSYERIA
jgi:KTSC domain